MRNPTEFGRAGPANTRPPRRGWVSFYAFAALAVLIVACTDSDKKPVTGPATVSGPSYGLTDPFNAGDKCLAADAFLSGFTSGVKDSLKLADPTKSCTANDIRIATAVVDSISTDGVNFVKFSGQNVTCNAGDPLFLQMAAVVDETSTSQRTDIGIWIGLSGSNGRTGSCNQYNLTDQGIPTGGTVGGVSNIDGDQCGDMQNGDSTLVQLGKIQLLCQAATPQDSLVHVGSCLAWTVPGSDQVCPRNPPGGPNGFRWATTPSSTSKCNCEGFNLPITVVRHAFLEVVKACSPSQIPGATFDLLIDGSNANADNVGCGGTTGKQQLSAGSNAHPGAQHSHGEGDFGGGFTSADFNSSFACVNRGTNVSRGSGTSLGPNNITLQPDDDVVCTYTNVLRPKLKLVKLLVPTNDAGKFDFTIAGTLFNNGGAGYGHNGTTDFQTVSIGSVSFSEAAHSGTTLSEYASSLECRNAANVVIASNPNATNTAGSVTTAAGDRITCTFTNNHAPKLSITKTPDFPNGGAINPGQIAAFTVTVSAASDGGPASNVVITDTLPADVGDWTENPNKAECTVTPLSGQTANRLLVCSIATLNPGTSFTVVVQATVPSNFLQIPPDPNGPTAGIEIDGNLVDDPAVNGKDWGTPGLISCSNPVKGCDLDLPTGQNDNAFGGGTSEDDAVPKVVTGSIPNNKSDLQRFYIANERVNVQAGPPIVAHDFLYLAWERVQNPSGTTNMDFELNQSTQISSNNTTPVRTAGDILIKYDLSQGGTVPTLGFHRWVTSGTCEANGGKAPCWGPVISLVGNPNVAAAVNTGTVTDPIAPNAGRNVDPFTFGEARIDLQATGIFPPGQCVSFGRAYLKSRSSDSFTSEIKDFIAPIPVSVNNCAPRDLPNRAWVKAANFAPPGGNLGDPINDTGLIHVSDATGLTGSQLTTPTTLRLAQLPASEGFVVPSERRGRKRGGVV